jgi:hypothetical protein
MPFPKNSCGVPTYQKEKQNKESLIFKCKIRFHFVEVIS